MKQPKRGAISLSALEHRDKDGNLTHITLRKTMKVSAQQEKTRSFHIQANRIPEVVGLLQNCIAPHN